MRLTRRSTITGLTVRRLPRVRAKPCLSTAWFWNGTKKPLQRIAGC
jgi:hypothetical protein